MEPVELDINIRGNAAEESARISSGVSSIGDASKGATEELRRSIELQRQYLAKLQKEIKSIELEVKSSPQAQATLGKHLKSLKAELIDETEGLKHLQSELRMTTQAKESLRSKIFQVKDAMAQMVNAGEQETEAYREARRELATLNDAYQTVTREQRLMTQGAQSLTGMIGALQGLMGAVTATAGAYGAISGESERYARIQTKVQSLMAITIGMQQLQQSLSATSAFRVQTLASVTRVFGRAQQFLASTLHISNGAAKALTATLTLGLSVAITAVATAIDRYVSRQREAAEASKAWSRAVADGAGESIARYEALRREYAALEGDEEKRSRFVKEHKKDFDALGVSIGTATEADNIFITNADAFRQSLLDRAKAVASFDLAVEQYKEALRQMDEADTREANPNIWDKVGGFLAGIGPGYGTVGGPKNARDYARLNAEKMRREADEAMTKAEDRIRQYLGYTAKADQLLKDAGISTSSEDKPKKDPPDERARLAALKRIAKLGADAERSVTAMQIAAMEEGRAQKLRQLDEEHRERKAKITEQLREIEMLERQHHIDATPQKARLRAVSEAEEADYRRRREEISRASDSVIREVEEGASARFRSDLEQRLGEVDAYYDRLIKRAQESAADEVQLARTVAQVEAARQRERELRTREHELRLLDRREEIEVRRMAITTKRYDLEADREEEQLRRQLELSEKRLRKLREIEAAGGDAAADIKRAREEIEGLKHALEEIPARRLREVGKALQGVFSSLSSVGGEMGEVFGAAAASVGDILSALKEGATTMDAISSAASGLSRVIGMVTSQARANAEEEARYARQLEQSYHRAAMARIRAFDEKDRSIFGLSNPYRGAIEGARRYRQAMLELGRSMERLRAGRLQVGTTKVVSGANIAKGAAGGAAAGAAIGSIIPGLGTAIGAALGGLFGGIAGAAARKTVPVFKSLTRQYGQILKEGSRTFELNPRILEDYDRLDDATKRLVDNWEEIRKEALSAQEEMRETFRQLAGDIGSLLSKALSDAFSSGDWETSLDHFEEEVDQMIGRIVDQLLLSAVFGRELEKMQKSMEDSFGEGGDGTIVDELIDFKKKYRDLVATYRREREAADRELGLQGVSTHRDSAERKAVARRGLAQASQDSIDELMGIATNQLLQLRLLVEASRAGEREAKLREEVLRSIARDVATIASYAPRLDLLEEVSRDIATLRRDGVIIKQ